MTQQNNARELKVKTQFLINLSSRKEEKKEKFSNWLNAQSNAQSSFLSLVEHMIDRFGYTDIMDHEIARKLHVERLHFAEETDIESHDSESLAAKGIMDDDKNESIPSVIEDKVKAPSRDVRIDPDAF